MTKAVIPVLAGELKCFRLRHSRKGGMTNIHMSSVVRIIDSVGVGICHVSFAHALVETIGSHMPRGAGPEDPVFLRAEQQLDGTWFIYSQYIRSREHTLLWIAPCKPYWVQHIRRFDSR